MADAFGDGLFSVFDDEQQTNTNKKTHLSAVSTPENPPVKLVSDTDAGPSVRGKRGADGDYAEDVVFGKKSRPETVSSTELNLAELMPQVKVEQVETVEGCSHEVAIPANDEYKPLRPRVGKAAKKKQRVIFTSPIKALSNQKYREMYEEFQDVGLMTGDVTINPTASCLVMTTERGVVWEETIILLPDNVHYVFLSATIPNARQFAEWICYLHKQPCHVVYTEYRPTPLQHYIFPAGGDGLHLVVDENGDFREDNFNTAMQVLRDAGDSGGGVWCGGKWDPRGRKGGLKIVKMIMERNFQPVSFSVSAKKNVRLMLCKLAKLDFNKRYEKRLVEEVFNNAIDCLSDEDKKLPQVEHVLPLLKRGIGIHHGGLLPILKETIEILFSEGFSREKYCSALFATETFAMGINMPARTVLFTSARKFDGKNHRFRNCDLMVDEKMSPAVGKQLLKGSADPLNSAFHLTYNMVLNLLRVEEINPEYMLEKSFYQFQHYRALPGVVEKMRNLEDQYHSIDIPNEESAVTYYKIRQQLAKLGKEIQEFIHKPKYCLPFLQPGRLVKVKNEDADFGWGVVVNFCKKSNTKSTAEAEPLYVVEVLLHCSKDSVKDSATEAAKPAAQGETGEMQTTWASRTRTEEVIQKVEAFEHRMYSHSLHSDPSLEMAYSLCEKKALIAADVRAAKRELKKARTVLQMDQLKCRKRVLRRLGFASPSDVIEMKGRVACEISSADELLLTEMVFNGLFNDLTVEQATALLSCFVFQENASEMPKLTEQLAAPLRQMQECAKRIAKVSADAKLEVDEETYMNQFKPHLMDVVYAWANGATFAQICKMTDVFEGSIIRCMRRLEEVLRQMCSAAKAIGNTELENKFAEGITKIKRDIVFAASLYL
ncbi:hypothetical protein WMY93_021826 [Mugilogobius chulae]|uniref:RNA helicase n=1 Tax=Mugilogobius chulae TaxID=88201 RepID=A0AAW0NP91_9GOBI